LLLCIANSAATIPSTTTSPEVVSSFNALTIGRFFGRCSTCEGRRLAPAAVPAAAVVFVLSAHTLAVVATGDVNSTTDTIATSSTTIATTATATAAAAAAAASSAV
jgi:hypothetical protein